MWHTELLNGPLCAPGCLNWMLFQLRWFSKTSLDIKTPINYAEIAIKVYRLSHLNDLMLFRLLSPDCITAIWGGRHVTMSPLSTLIYKALEKRISKGKVLQFITGHSRTWASEFLRNVVDTSLWRRINSLRWNLSLKSALLFIYLFVRRRRFRTKNIAHFIIVSFLCESI